jgi:iron complex outermembrane receptor protein
LLGAAAVALLTAAPQQASAAEDTRAPSGADGSATSLGDIVVTAQRVESLASKTPIALSAFSGAQLTARSITNPTQLGDDTPNVMIVRGNGLQIVIRGVTSRDGTEKGDPSAAFLLDGVYLARPQEQELSFFDVERVEILRGPQGTLYGRNTTAGVVNVITATPKQEFQASADVSYTNFNHVNATGMINVPVSDNFALRAAVNYDRRDSYFIKNTADTNTLDPFKNNLSARVSALYKPTDNLKFVLRLDYGTEKGVPMQQVPLRNFYTGTGVGGAFVPLQKPIYLDNSTKAQRTTTFPEKWQGFRDNSQAGATLQADWDAGFAAFTYLGSYRKYNRDEGTTFASISRNTATGHYRQNSQEIRAAFGGEGPLQGQIGAYYFYERSRTRGFSLDPSAFGLQGFTAFGFVANPTKARSLAGFGQFSYDVTDQLKLTAGARWTKDKKSRIGALVGETATAVTSFGANQAEATYSQTTWRLGADYDVPGLGLFYATVSTGYKAGGFNDGCQIGEGPSCRLSSDALYFSPEKLTSFEAGAKLSLFDNKLRLNTSAFHYDYKDLQVTSTLPDCGGGFPCGLTTNAATSRVNGVEFEALWRPVTNHIFNFNVNWLDAKYKSYNPTPTRDFSGRPLSLSPKWTLSAGYTYTHPLANGANIEFNAKTRYSAKYDLTDIGAAVFFYQKAYTKSDLSLTYKSPGDRFTASVFARNLENNLAVSSAFIALGNIAVFDDPRTFGIRLGVKY